jgi:hypothetical protein
MNEAPARIEREGSFRWQFDERTLPPAPTPASRSASWCWGGGVGVARLNPHANGAIANALFHCWRLRIVGLCGACDFDYLRDMVKLRSSPEEIARMGDTLYASVVEPHIAPSDDGQFVAIDVESGAYEIAPDELSAIDRLRARKPDAQLWLQRVGVSYTHHFGPRARHPEDTPG